MPPGRFRSKTGDISDIWRSSTSRHSESHSTPVAPTPPTQVPEVTTPTKAKRKPLAFLGRKRKSSVSPSPSSLSAKSNEQTTTSPEEIPPVPGIPAKHTQLHGSSAEDDPPSTPPTSLPPLNVSPPSFGFSHFTPPKKGASDVTRTPDPAKSSGIKPPQPLRGQKSTSFEFVGRARLAENTPNRGSRPVITVSAPPKSGHVAADAKDTANTAPAASTPSRRTLRKPLALSFSYKKAEPEKVTTPSPTSPRIPVPSSPKANVGRTPPTPPLPTQMRFPIPPRQRGHITQPSQDSLKSLQRRSRNSGLSDETLASSPKRESFSSASASIKTYVPGDKPLREKDGSISSSASNFLPLPEEISPTRARFSTGSGPPTGSIGKAVGASLVKPPKAVPPPLRLSVRRASRSPSPASSPPTAPLPDLPPEASGSPVREAAIPTVLSPGPYAPRSPTLSTSTVPSIPSMPTVASKRSVASLRQRSGTQSRKGSAIDITVQGTISARSSPTANHEGNPETPTESTHTQKAESPVHSRQPSKDLDKLSRQDSEKRRLRKIDTYAAQHHLLGEAISLRAKHDILIRSLRELHAAEKADLLRRIEQLEREAKKKDREIKGLRWLVLNTSTLASDPGFDATRLSALAESKGRSRSGSKASDLNYCGSPTQDQDQALDSPRDSTEEGLYEVQASVSDLISPVEDTPPTTFPEPKQPIKTRSKRSNTVPNGSHPPVFDLKALAKQARRSSSPISNESPILASSSSKVALKGTTGLGIGIDYPSIPSLSESSASGSHGSTKTSASSSAMTVPSLTANTTSSSLSAIPESPRFSPEVMNTDEEGRRREKEERRASRALRRLSASSSITSTSLMAASPSIDQVLDSPMTQIDDVLRKLRAIAGPATA